MKNSLVPAEHSNAANAEVDWQRGTIRLRDGRRAKLPAQQAALLACLARKAGRPVSREEILVQAWQLDPARTFTRTIDVHVSLLRRTLASAGVGAALVTVHRVGYMLRTGGVVVGDAHSAMGGSR